MLNNRYILFILIMSHFFMQLTQTHASYTNPDQDCIAIKDYQLQSSKDFLADELYYNPDLKIILDVGEARVDCRGAIFFEETDIPEGLKYLHIINSSGNAERLRENSFRFLESLVELSFPESLSVIEDDCLVYLTNLERLTLPEKLIEIGDGVLVGCEKLKSLMIPGTVRKIGGWFGVGCSQLEITEMSNSLEETGDCFLAACPNLREISFPESLKRVGINCLANCEKVEKLPVTQTPFERGDFFMYGCRESRF